MTHLRNPENTRPKKNGRVPRSCSRCGGGGYVPIPVDGGRCWGCMGSGRGTPAKAWAFPPDWTDDQCTAWLDDHNAKLEAKRAERKKAADEARESERLEVVAKNTKAAGVRALNFKTDNSFILDIQAKAQKYLLSQKQVEALKKAIQRERDKKKQAKHAIWPTQGRQEITGQVVSIKLKDGFYGPSFKMMIQCGGYRLYGTCPSALQDCGIGARVTFTATVEPKEAGFGFFSRPAGGVIE